MTPSHQQDQALVAIRDWHRSSSDQVFYLAGYAGTGKTTIARKAVEGIWGRVLFGAFTGKAALVLRSKGCRDASTIHSLIYKSYEVEEKDAEGNVIRVKVRYGLDPFSEVDGASIVVIDECSMVDERLGRDLLSFGTKVLVIGDPAQLPPVRGEGFFTARAPDFMLTEIHRQARDNPIIRMSMQVREGGRLERGTHGRCRVLDAADHDPARETGSDQILVGLNKTRKAMNDRVRRKLGRDVDYPEVGDKLVCLKNNKEKGLLNGGLWTISEIHGFDEDGVNLTVVSSDVADLSAKIYVRREFFQGCEDEIPWHERRESDEFTYGYALTVHKAQGSQWDDVLLIDQSRNFRQDRARHLYTAITRAAEGITVVLA